MVWLALVCFVLSAGPLAAQTRILTGTVRDSATGGALAGLALAVWAVRAVVAAAPPQIPRLTSVSIDWTIVAAGAALTRPADRPPIR